MKNKKIGKIWKAVRALSVALTIAIVGANLGAIDALAGSSDIVIDATSFAEQLDETKWNNPSGELTVEGGKVIFPADSTGEARLITANPIKISEYHEEFLKADYTLKLKTLPSGEKFMVAFGLTTLESYYGEAGNLEIVFENKGGIKVSVLAYDENAEAKTLAKAQSCGASLGQNIRIGVSVTADMKLKITVNNKTLYNGQSPIDLEGRVGFLQTGNCAAQISALNIVSHSYDAPENVNITEDFESGSINVNTLTSRMMNSCLFFPSRIQVEEYNGSQVLMFRNVGSGYFGTTYQYSNFEATFDVPYIQYKNVLRENGTIQMPASSGLAFAIADEAIDYKATSYTTAADAIIFGADSLYNLKGTRVPVSFADKKFANQDKNEGYSVKISVIDTVVTISMKALDSTKYEEIHSYKMGNATPTGYVHIWSVGQANFAIDNFTIVNKDKEGKTIDAEYQTGFMTGTEDWEYEPVEETYLDTEHSGDSGFSWGMLMVSAAAFSLIILAVCLIITKAKKTPKIKEVKADEV